jgi:hypothetical protein
MVGNCGRQILEEVSAADGNWSAIDELIMVNFSDLMV